MCNNIYIYTHTNTYIQLKLKLSAVYDEQNQTKVIKIAQYKCFKLGLGFPQIQLKRHLLMTSAVSKCPTLSWQASLVLSRTHSRCFFDLLQTRCITRHQLLAAFLRNLSPFLMNNGLQFSNTHGFRVLQPPSSNSTKDFIWGLSQVTVMASTVESSRTSSANKPWWILRYA